MNPHYQFNPQDTDRANNLRNILCALINLKTQIFYLEELDWNEKINDLLIEVQKRLKKERGR